MNKKLLYLFALLSLGSLKASASESKIGADNVDKFPIHIQVFSKNFLNVDVCTPQVAKKFGITHLLLGGSLGYKHFEAKTNIDQIRDIDLILLVQSKRDMFQLIRHEKMLVAMLGIAKPEICNIHIPEDLEKHIDAIRFAGWKANGEKNRCQNFIT